MRTDESNKSIQPEASKAEVIPPYGSMWQETVDRLGSDPFIAAGRFTPEELRFIDAGDARVKVLADKFKQAQRDYEAAGSYRDHLHTKDPAEMVAAREMVRRTAEVRDDAEAALQRARHEEEEAANEIGRAVKRRQIEVGLRRDAEGARVAEAEYAATLAGWKAEKEAAAERLERLREEAEAGKLSPMARAERGRASGR